MIPIKNLLTKGGTSTSLKAGPSLKHAASRAQNDKNIEAEEWVAADVEETGSPTFSEALTIDELYAARTFVDECVHDCMDEPPAFLLEQSSDELDSCTSSCSRVEADEQMFMIEQSKQSLLRRRATTEYLDAAICVAADKAVQNAVMKVLITNPDVQAALQRGFAAEGISVDLQHLRSKVSLLPAAASVGSHGIEITEVSEEDKVEDTRNASLKEIMATIISDLTQNASAAGANVKHVLRSVIRRWRSRLRSILNPGNARSMGGQARQESRAVEILDGISMIASLIVTVAFLNRVAVR